ncbi:hypothetical protein [Streptomyces sp. AC555_RSS877]|uniref:hypothetical protein n=1 Tax=Streptomyces sp. AC555_RSS877 TaxID=2823688 RepID=UPI0020B77C84|nr:hypothetical protein [Streptomyces sp. AC555_RSS877]
MACTTGSWALAAEIEKLGASVRGDDPEHPAAEPAEPAAVEPVVEPEPGEEPVTAAAAPEGRALDLSRSASTSRAFPEPDVVPADAPVPIEVTRA